MVDRPNRLARIIEDGGNLLKQDNWAKGLFSLKSVIARVVKACVPEYASFSHELIANECLEDFQDDSGRFYPEFAKALLTSRPLPIHLSSFRLSFWISISRSCGFHSPRRHIGGFSLNRRSQSILKPFGSGRLVNRALANSG